MLVLPQLLKNMKDRQASMPNSNLRDVSGVALLMVGCNKDLMANGWGKKCTEMQAELKGPGREQTQTQVEQRG